MSDTFPPDGDLNTYSGFVLKQISKTYKNLVIDYRVTELFGGESLPCTFDVRSTLLSVEFQDNSQLSVIQDHAFLKCTSLTKLDFSSCSKLSSIGNYAFSGCTAATSITLPSSSYSLGEYCFNNCESLSYIFIPRTVTKVAFACFASCYNLPTITFESKSCIKTLYKWIGVNSGITSFCIPASVTSITPGTFEAAYSLETITVEEGSTSFKIIDSAVVTNDKTRIVAFPPNKACEFVFPESITYIYGFAFAYNHLSKVNISKKLSRIPEYSFRDSPTLEEVTIPGSVQYIDSCAFYGCYNLKLVTILKGCKEIGESAFYNCKINEIVIPEGVEIIRNNCFDQCSELTEIILPSTLITLGGNAFPSNQSINISFSPGTELKMDNNMLVTNVKETILSQFVGTQTNFKPVLQDSIVTIKANAFSAKTNLISVSFNENSNLSTIESKAFYKCTNLGSFTFPKSLVSIGTEAFRGCSKLKKLEFLEKLSTISTGAFRECTGVTELSLEKSIISSISSYAFCQCTSLTTVTLPEKIRYFSQYCFSLCYKLEHLTIPSGAIIASIEQYSFSNTLISSFEINQDSTISSIGAYAFSYCPKLTSFTFVPSIVTICSFAFAYSGLTEVRLSESISKLEGRCFYGCSSVQTFVIPENSYLNSNGLGLGIFGCCKSFSKIECESQNFKVIIGALFTNDEKTLLIFPPALNISSLSIPESVSIISNGAFIGCSNLLSVIIPIDSMKTIGASAFEDCINLNYINIPESVTTIGESAFKGCKKLKLRIFSLINNAQLLKTSMGKYELKFTCKYNAYKSTSRTSIDVIICFLVSN